MLYYINNQSPQDPVGTLMLRREFWLLIFRLVLKIRLQ